MKADLEHLLGERHADVAPLHYAVRSQPLRAPPAHRDPQGRYSAIVMTWGPGQGTAVHDHGGLWCVEGVVDGEIAVTQYLVQADTDGYYRVTPIGSLLAGTGSAGCLIPPTDHHVLANARPSKASITLHIYGGDGVTPAAENEGLQAMKRGTWYVEDQKPSVRTVDSHVRRIRQKLGALGADPIETVYGLGYRMREQLE